MAGVLRRTCMRLTRNEIAAVGSLLVLEAIEMTDVPVIYPSPGSQCLTCEFALPCLALFEGADPKPVLSRGFRRRSENAEQRLRLGQATWGFGRGAATPGW
jgi:hypothetical protein